MRKKIVINRCYGGFNLSPLAVQWLIDNGLDICPSSTWDDDDDFAPYPECEFDFPSQIPRHNLLLVACVEELGAAADGECSQLKVMELPGNQYKITERNGDEWLTTPETILWTVVPD